MKQKVIDFLNIFSALNKSIVMFLLLAISIIFRVKGYLNGDNFVELIKSTVISYYGVTGLVHFTSMIKDHLASKTTAAIVGDSSDVPVEEDDSAVDAAQAIPHV